MWNKHARSVCAGEQPLQRKVDANHSEISKAKVSLSIKEGDQRRDKERRAARREATSEMWRIAGNREIRLAVTAWAMVWQRLGNRTGSTMNGKRKSESKKPPIDDQDDRLWLNMQIERRLIGCDREYCIRLIGELDERM